MTIAALALLLAQACTPNLTNDSDDTGDTDVDTDTDVPVEAQPYLYVATSDYSQGDIFLSQLNEDGSLPTLSNIETGSGDCDVTASGGQALFTNRSSGTVSLLSPTGFGNEITNGASNPYGATLAYDGQYYIPQYGANHLLVVNSSGNITELDITDESVVGSVGATFPQPPRMAFGVSTSSAYYMAVQALDASWTPVVDGVILGFTSPDFTSFNFPLPGRNPNTELVLDESERYLFLGANGSSYELDTDGGLIRCDLNTNDCDLLIDDFALDGDVVDLSVVPGTDADQVALISSNFETGDKLLVYSQSSDSIIGEIVSDNYFAYKAMTMHGSRIYLADREAPGVQVWDWDSASSSATYVGVMPTGAYPPYSLAFAPAE